MRWQCGYDTCFWSEYFWLPASVTWEDLENKDDPQTRRQYILLVLAVVYAVLKWSECIPLIQAFKSFKAAKAHFSGEWAAERRQVIAELKIIQSEVQEQAKIYARSSIENSIVSLVSGCLIMAGIVTAPSTLGVSLVLSAAGVVAGVASGIAGVYHGVVKMQAIKMKFNEAKAIKEKHNISSSKMRSLIAALKEEIDEFKLQINGESDIEISQTWEKMGYLKTAASSAKGIATLMDHSRAIGIYIETGNVDEVARILNPKGVLLPSAITKFMRKPSAIAALKAFGIAFSLGSLFYNAVHLSDMEDGKLCNEAQELEKVIKNLQKEYDVLSQFFD